MPWKVSSMLHKTVVTVVLATSITAIIGCGDASPRQPATDGPALDGPATDAAVSDPAATEPPLEVASWAKIQARIAAQTGKVVVVDLWSTTCEPCLRELPGLVTLQQKFPNKVVCMSVNLDYTGAAAETPEDHREKVARVLTRHQMDFPNFISSTSDFDVYDAIQLASIPAILVYDLTTETPSTATPTTETHDITKLSPAKRFDNDLNQYGDEGFSYEQHVTPLVEQLLNEAEGPRKPKNPVGASN